MIVDRKSAPRINFINKNIQICTNRNRTILASAPKFTVEGVSVLLYRKNKLKSAATKKTEVIPKPILKKSPQSPPVVPQPSLPPTLLIKKTYSGIRRTSIKCKQSTEFIEESPKLQYSKPGKEEVVIKRQVLKLGVTKLPSAPIFPVFQEPNRNLLLKIAGRAFLRYKGKDACEAIEDVERFLTAMDKSGAQFVSRPDTESININSINQPSNYNNNKESQDESYHEVYQRHVNKLNEVIAQGEKNENRNSEKKKIRKRSGPKLEIKIGPTADSYITALTQELEEFNLLEVENPGDLTPVITYNHVSTVSTPDEFQYGSASPGGSSKGSRSPSPLLEVPAKGVIELSTKFPAS